MAERRRDSGTIYKSKLVGSQNEHKCQDARQVR